MDDNESKKQWEEPTIEIIPFPLRDIILED